MATQTFRDRYYSEVLPNVQKRLGEKNPMATPRIDKIKVHVGIGSILARGAKDTTHIENHLKTITGQKPVITSARKSVSNFKIRKGMPVGMMVTLRGQHKLDFLEKLTTLVFPRVRDFRGISDKSFDKAGNYNIGFREMGVFPEIEIEDFSKDHGLQITISTTANSKEEGKVLFEELGFPFRN